jgi:hypothetical protein
MPDKPWSTPTPHDASQAALLEAITEHCTAARIVETTFGRKAVGDTTFVERLRAGRVTVNLCKRAWAYIEAAADG